MGADTIRVLFFDLGDTLVTSGRPPQWVPGARELLASLRGTSVRLGIISNTGTLTRAQLAPLLPGDFDWTIFEPSLIVLSSEVGHEKPSRAIFERALAPAGVEPATCLFCTESLMDTLAAQSAGMRVARIIPPPSSDLDKLLTSLKQTHLLPDRP
jgi:FMN phosphatase YigB (HAD superfamily)